MFETIQSKRHLVAEYLAQLLAVPIIVGALSLPAFGLYLKLTGSVAGTEAGIWDCAGVGVLLGVGFAVGRLAFPRWESLAPTGLWVWLPPTCASIAGFLQAWLSPYEHAEALSITFRSTGAHEGIVRLIGTDPAFSLAGYSLGLYFAVRARKRKARPPAPPSAAK